MKLLLALFLCAGTPVRQLSAAQCPDGSPPPCGSRARALPSVAVLYFDTRSRDSGDAYLADGLTEEIIARLTRIERLRVKSRTAVERFRQGSAPPDSLGRALGVAHIVSGSVQRAGRRLRVSVELVRVSTGEAAWAAAFDRSDADMLDIQAAIADTVAQEIAGLLAPNERRALTSRPTRNAAAWDAFLRGNYRLARRTPADVRLAIREYERAVSLDPRFAAAHARIALSYSVALDWGWIAFDVQESIRQGMASSARALALDSLLADGWTARGYVLRYANARNYAGVREAFNRAIALAPRDAEAALQYGWALTGLGDTPAAIDMLRRAVSLDPERSISRFTLAFAQLFLGQAREAALTLDTAITLDPTDQNLYGIRAWARLLLSDTAGARDDIRPESAEDSRMSGSAQVMLFLARGDSTAARALTDSMIAAWPAAPARVSWAVMWSATAAAMLGQVDRAIELLARIEPQGLPTWWITRFPGFDGIRNNERFVSYVRSVSPPGN